MYGIMKSLTFKSSLLSKTITAIKAVTPTPTGLNDIEKLLEPVKELVFDSGSEGSDLTDIFEEFHRNSNLRAYADPRKKYLTKTEADKKTVDEFPDEFKRTMEKVRQELNLIDKPPFDDSSSEVDSALNIKLSINKNVMRSESPIIAEQFPDKDSVSSFGSQVWQLLESNNEEMHFKVSPPIFNTFRQKQKHWLERPPVDWRKVDESKEKCEKWLQEIMD